jgi:pimeloyl-ACP methyl ester carboxylesterase
VNQSTPTTFPAFKSEGARDRYRAAYDAALGDWPVPYEALDIPTAFGPTHVIISGPADAPPLVLLHSFAGSATVWRPNVAGLSERFRTYAVDVIGQPGRSLATRRMKDRREFAAWYGQMLDGLGIDRACIVGCSFGGFLALNQASLTPARVERVVLISPAGTFTPLSLWFAVIMLSGPLRRRIRKFFGDKRPPQIADLDRRRAPPNPADAAWRRLMSVTMTESPKTSMIRAHVFSRRELRRITAPVLLLIGDRERLYQPRATLALAMRRMPRLTGAIVPNAGHIAALDQPEDVNARIVDFLNSPSPQS